MNRLSNWDRPDSFIGSNYGFREYFAGALREGTRTEFALSHRFVRGRASVQYTHTNTNTNIQIHTYFYGFTKFATGSTVGAYSMKSSGVSAFDCESTHLPFMQLARRTPL